VARTRKLRRPAPPPSLDAPQIHALAQALIDLHAESVCVLDREQRHVAANAAWRASVGIGDKSFFGKTPLELYGIRDDRFEEEFAQVLAGNEVIRTFQLPGDEGMAQIHLSPWRGPDGEILGVISRHSWTDAAQPGLQARERRLRMAMDMAQIHAFEIDFRTGRATYEPERPGRPANGLFSYEAMLGSLPESSLAMHRENWARHLETGEPIKSEYQIFEGGELIWRRTRAEAVTDLDGQVVGMIGVSQNIDERKQIELELIAEKEAAQAADQSKSEFLANISHEIRTPLNGVLGLASQLRRTRLDGVQNEMVRTIEASAQTLNALLSDVLDLAKIESGHLELDPQPFDPEEVVRHLHRLFRGAASAKGLDFRCEVDASVAGLALADSTRVNQVLTNLISNAIKFTATGFVELKAWAEGEGCDQRLAFSVTDSGAGIAREALPRLFERFVQADGSISRSYGGTGLGLAISRNLARMMDGDVAVASEPGGGSTFTLTLKAPRWREDGSSRPADEAGSRAILPTDRRLQVLLVEDHPVNRRVVELILGDVADLDCAENGALGLAAFRTRTFDVVLMDMQMPVMDGLEATRAIRAYEQLVGAPRTPIIMLSANALSEHVRSGHEAGADLHLAKPITAEDLMDALARALEATGCAQPLAQAG
jgi:signal transduction histidine kinase/ActR/RegA family two-component response regulator